MKTAYRKKSGVVILLDALGASGFSDAQIRDFLAARSTVNSMLSELATFKPSKTPKLCEPKIFTFGDTIAITIELRSKKYKKSHLYLVSWLLRRYIYRSLEHGILFRGAFSLGNYFADPDSNTVMGPAVSDAAAWYEKADWAGVMSTPYTKNMLDYEFMWADGNVHPGGYFLEYPVPLKGGRSIDLYTLDWPSAFFDKDLRPSSSKSADHYFLELLKPMRVPYGTESKFENTRAYWNFSAALQREKRRNSDGA